MLTLQQIRSKFRDFINQPGSDNSDFSDSELNGLANDAVVNIATTINWPKDKCSIQLEAGVPVYPLMSDTMRLLIAYYGDKTKSGEPYKIDITDEEKIAEDHPSWLSEHEDNWGVPSSVVLINRREFQVYPTPDADAADGKEIFLGYVYYPRKLGQDGDVPDIPAAYHNLVHLDMAHLAYLGQKLKNPDLARQVKADFDKYVKAIKPMVENVKRKYEWSWPSSGNYVQSDDLRLVE